MNGVKITFRGLKAYRLTWFLGNATATATVMEFTTRMMIAGKASV